MESLSDSHLGSLRSGRALVGFLSGTLEAIRRSIVGP